VTVLAGAGRVPDGTEVPGLPLKLAKSAVPGNLDLSWSTSCHGGDTDYEVYEGALGNFTSHTPKLCTTSGATAATITPAAANRYYLVVPRSPDGAEGSYGTKSLGVPRPQSQTACVPQHVIGCP
jgi:hypothetical protein